MKDCGVFGVASDEYLDFASENGDEWVIKGTRIAAKMLENYKN